ncbi:hypothetical protein Tco_1346262 [Tanacetum coccineum]
MNNSNELDALDASSVIMKAMVDKSRQQHTEQPEFNNKGEVDENVEQCHDIRPLPAKLTDDKTTELLINHSSLKMFVSKRLLPSQIQASVFMALTYGTRRSSLVLHQMTSDHNRSELGIHDHSNEPSSSKLVPKVVPLAVVRLGNQSMIQTRTGGKDRPKDNPKLEIAVLSDTNVFTMKMEILLEPASNKLLVKTVMTVSQSTKVDSLPHIHANSTKTIYHESSRFKDKDFRKL